LAAKGVKLLIRVNNLISVTFRRSGRTASKMARKVLPFVVFEPRTNLNLEIANPTATCNDFGRMQRLDPKDWESLN
jgi:hypothetical protein